MPYNKSTSYQIFTLISFIGDEPASPDQMNSIIMRNERASVKTPVIPLPSRLDSQASTTSSSYRESSLRNIKPIDSVDSVAGILADTKMDRTPRKGSGERAVVSIKGKSKFDEIHEGDGKTNIYFLQSLTTAIFKRIKLTQALRSG